MATQLRDYRITEGSLDQFVDEWRRHLAPVRRELGFTISGAWTVAGESRFVWLLAFPGDWDAFDEADRRYFASSQRAAISPDPARLIEQQAVARLDEVGIG
jgi:hypothetical protein